MALPVLDGNQSATTLSSVVTGGEHIVAHSVVSLGATAISNINSAVSGTAVTIPGLARLGSSIASDNTADANLDFIKIGGHQDGQNQVAHIVHVSAGGAMKVDASGSSVTFSQAPVTFGAITGSASILNFPSTQTIAGTVTANGGDFVFSESQDTSSAKGVLIGFEDDASTEYRKVTDAQPLPISISAINNTGGFSGSLPVSGTVTANVTGQVSVSNQPSEIIIKGYDFTDDEYEVLRTDQDGVLLVAPNGTIAVVGTVTANPTGTQTVAGTVTVANQPTLISYNGQITATAAPAILARGEYSATGWTTLQGVFTEMREDGVGIPIGLPSGVTSLGVSVGNSVTIGSLPAISGTVTANTTPLKSSPSFLTGTVTATNLTSIVSAGSRNYLRIQAMEGGSGSALLFVSFNGTNDHAVLQTSVLQNSATTYPYSFSARTDTLEFNGNWVPQTEIWIRSSSASGKPYSIIYA